MPDHVASARRAPISDPRQMQDRIEELEEEVRRLREMLAPALKFPLELRLSPMQERILSAIYARAPNIVAHQRIFAAVYPDPDTAPETNSLAVQVSILRRKMKPYGVEIKNRWGDGLYIDKASAAIIAAMLCREAPQEGGAPPP
jgi:DNA-binding response OmpR family regulator